MIPTSGSIRKIWLTVFILGGIAFIRPDLGALAQENQQYTVEEYEAYQAIAKEADPAKKMELISAFWKSWPKSTLAQHITADFQEALKKLQEAGRWAQVITIGRQFLALSPDDAYTTALVAEGYVQTKNNRQLVAFGEEAYKKNPTGNLAYAMAKAYKDLGNTVKFWEWGEKTVAAFPDNYEIMLEMAILYSDSKRNAEADKYAKRTLKTIQAAKKPEQMSDKDWAAYTNRAYLACNLVIGNAAYERQDYTNAIPAFESALKYNSRNDTAYYFLGQAYWQQRKIDLAMKNFAKASLLNGTASGSARQQLENLYKQTHKQSTVGLDKVIAVAKAELGIK